jgi:hypothetical protein
MFIVMIDLWNNTRDDYYDFEYSGIEWKTREEAEAEYDEALPKLREDPTFKTAYIREV